GEQIGRISLRIEQYDIGVPDQVPAARCLQRIHTRLRSGDRDAPRRHAPPGRRPARQRQRRIDRSEVREAGNKPEEIDVVDRVRVATDDVQGNEPGTLGDLGEVGPVVADGNDVNGTVLYEGRALCLERLGRLRQPLR